jgi:hypothetical protein
MYVHIFFVASVTSLILDITEEVLGSLLVHVEVELQRLVDVDSGRVLCHDLDVSGEVAASTINEKIGRPTLVVCDLIC